MDNPYHLEIWKINNSRFTELPTKTLHKSVTNILRRVLYKMIITDGIKNNGDKSKQNYLYMYVITVSNYAYLCKKIIEYFLSAHL